MKMLMPALIALAIAATTSLAMAAEAKTCKAGKVLNPETGKCVVVRGS